MTADYVHLGYTPEGSVLSVSVFVRKPGPYLPKVRTKPRKTAHDSTDGRD